MEKRKKWLIVFWVIFLMITFVSIEAGIYDRYPDGSMLLISSPLVGLGELKADPLNPTIEYFENTNALLVFFFPRSSRWQLVLSGEDFRSGINTIPLSQMEWMKDGGKYHKLSTAGKETVLAKNQDYKDGKNLRLLNLAFRLVLKGEEVPGRYSSSMVISLIFP